MSMILRCVQASAEIGATIAAEKLSTETDGTTATASAAAVTRGFNPNIPLPAPAQPQKFEDAPVVKGTLL
jgi:hypothetical protein